jgi:hypothetical protein
MHHHRAAAITGNFEAKLMASEEQRIVALLGRFREGSHLTQSSWLVAEEAYAESMSHIAEEEQACRLVEPGRVSRRGGPRPSELLAWLAKVVVHLSATMPVLHHLMASPSHIYLTRASGLC